MLRESECLDLRVAVEHGGGLALALVMTLAMWMRMAWTAAEQLARVGSGFLDGAIDNPCSLMPTRAVYVRYANQD